MRNVRLSDLRPSDGAIAGAPCISISSMGKRRGAADANGALTLRLLDWVIALAHKGALTFFLLDQSPELKSNMRGEQSFLDEILGILRKGLPYFVVRWDVSSVTSVLPQRRERIWIRGLRWDVLERAGASEIPRPLPGLPSGRILLADLLETAVPNVERASLTLARRLTLAVHERHLNEDRERGRAGQIAVLDLDRGVQGAFSMVRLYDLVPTLRTRGPAVFLVSMEDLGAPDSEKKIFRWLSVRERLMLQGHRAAYSECMPSDAATAKAAGNAYAVSQLGLLLLPMLGLLAKSGVVREQPEALGVEEIVRLTARATAALGATTAAQDSASLRGLLESMAKEPRAHLRMNLWAWRHSRRALKHVQSTDEHVRRTGSTSPESSDATSEEEEGKDVWLASASGAVRPLKRRRTA